MKKITIVCAAGMAAFVISGCGGSGTTLGNNGGGNTSIVTTDAPLATGNFMSLQPGPVTLRHAEGNGAVDHNNVARLLQVRKDPDDSHLGLLETTNGFTFNHGFSGSPVLMGNGIVGAIRQGSLNSSGYPDNTHAEMIDIKQMIDEHRNAGRSAAHSGPNKPYPMVYFAPSETLSYTNWRRTEQKFVGIDAATRAQAAKTAPAGRAGPGSYQGKGVAFMYSPYLYATGHMTYQVDDNTLLTLGHGLFEFPQDCNLPAALAFSYRMNDGTMAGIPDSKGMIGAATRSLNYSTVVDVSQIPTTSMSRSQMFSSNGSELKKVEHFLAKDNDAYMVGYANFINMAMSISRLIEAGYGSGGASGMAKAKLVIPTRDGGTFVYIKGDGGVMQAGGGGGGGGGGSADPIPFSGPLATQITDWVSMQTFDAYFISQQPVWGLATLEITKIDNP